MAIYRQRADYEARQFKEDMTIKQLTDLANWCFGIYRRPQIDTGVSAGFIEVFEGTNSWQNAYESDYIVRCPNGKYFVFAAKTFERTFIKLRKIAMTTETNNPEIAEPFKPTLFFSTAEEYNSAVKRAEVLSADIAAAVHWGAWLGVVNSELRNLQKRINAHDFHSKARAL